MNTMNPTHTDPEELRLVQNVAEKAMKWAGADFRGEGEVHDLGDLGAACVLLGDHRAKASAPVTPRFKIGDQVLVAGTVVQAATRITYLTFDGGPQEAPFRTESIPTFASPPNTDIREPTDAAISTLLDGIVPEGRDRSLYVEVLLEGLKRFSHYSPTVSRVEPKSLGGEFTTEDAAKVGHSLMDAIHASRDHPLMKDWAPAEDPAEIVLDLLMAYDEKIAPSPTQTQVTDEEIDGLAAIECSYTEPGKNPGERFYVFSPRLIREFARTLLAKHHPSISDSQWEAIRRLAIKEAPQVFAQEAREFLAGGCK